MNLRKIRTTLLFLTILTLLFSILLLNACKDNVTSNSTGTTGDNVSAEGLGINGQTGGNGEDRENDQSENSNGAETSGQDSGEQAVFAETGEEVEDLCYNPYIPYIPGKIWTYEITVDRIDEVQQFTVTHQRVDENTYIVTQEFQGYKSEVTWDCTEDGIISNEYAGFNVSGMPEGAEFDVIQFKGVTYPPPDEWKIGKTWSMEYTIGGEFTTEEGVKITYEGNVDMDYEITAIETVSVPAGTYNDAFKVDTKLKIDMIYKFDGFSQDVDVDLELETWYAKDVGMVKQVSGPQGESSTTVLLSME